KQFPFHLAYSTTFNSCQGLTFDFVVLDGRNDIFAHGQLYTAISCIWACTDTLLYITQDKPDVANIVYQQLLLPS
ncbi:hypothetical protein BS47DRAFT_1307414, partial [Hydnum rufescens UP504]